MYIMARGAGDFGIMLGVGLGQSLIDLGMALILVAGSTVLLRRVFWVANHHRLMRTGVTGHAHLRLNPSQMIGLAAFLAMTAETAWDKPMLGMAIGAGHGGMFARKILQSLRRGAMTVRAQIRLDPWQIKRGMGVRVTVMTDLNMFSSTMRGAMAIDTFGEGVRIFHLARGLGVIDFVAKSALLLVTISGCFKFIEHANMTLGTLLHSQRLHSLIKDGWTRRYLLDFIGQVNLTGFGVCRAAHGEYCRHQQTKDAQIRT